MILYIAGPMSGRPQFNYPQFLQAAELLRHVGYTVICPPESDTPEVREAALASTTGEWSDLPDQGTLLLDIIRKNVDDVLSSDGIALLPGWKSSRGAQMEVALGRRIGLPVMYASQWLEGRER